jgi:1,4-alpha-glucan branching enzyme
MITVQKTAMPVRAFIFITFLSLAIGCAPKSLDPVVLHEGVRFSYYAPSATNVSIAGSFNRWSPGRDRLTGPDKRGIWTIVLPLHPGRYEYRFVVNNTEWFLDPSAPFVDDGLGGKNSLFVVERDGN